MNRVLVVESVRGPLFVQDGGRRGAMHHAVPVGGALVPELLAASNRAVGNAWTDAALEIFGGVTLRAGSAALEIALDGVARRLNANEALTIDPVSTARVRYVAIAGGIDVPTRLGGRGTLASAGFGGFDGRALRRGDQIVARADRAILSLATSFSLEPRRTTRVIAGPDIARFADDALDALASATFTIAAASDRVGARLTGATLTRRDLDDAGSCPMVRGAIEVPADGLPIVLGPDHPTTGGYPVIAVVARVDHGAFAARRPGERVRFTVISIDEARTAWREHAARWFSDAL